jgi:GT2 family glycosyltransferase
VQLTNGARPVPEVTIVVIHHGDRELLRCCLHDLDAIRPEASFELVVVDNDGPSPSAASRTPVLQAAPPVHWIRNPRNLGFAVAANQGAAFASAPLLLFLNTDARLPVGGLRQMLDTMQADPGLAAVAPMTVPFGVGSSGARRPRDPRRRFLGPFSQAAGMLGICRGRRSGGGRCTGGAHRHVEVVGPFWLEACALVVRRAALRSVAGFDEGYFFYEEDEDLCWRLQSRGYRLAVCAGVHVEHEGGASARGAGGWPVRELYRGQARFVERRCGALSGLAYRVSVTLAALIKSCRRRRRRSLVHVLEGLWASPVTVSTKAA